MIRARFTCTQPDFLKPLRFRELAPAVRLGLLLLAGSLMSGCHSEKTRATDDILPTAPLLATPPIAERDSYAFGTVPVNSELAHEFVVTNDTTDIWKLTGITTSCGCTTAAPNRTIVQPSEELIIPVRVKTGKNGATRTQKIFLSFADGVPNRTLTVSYTARPPLSLIPEAQHFGARPGQQQEATIIVESFLDAPIPNVDFTVGSRTTRPSWLTISSVREVPITEQHPGIPIQRWTATMRIDSRDILPGEYVETVTVSAVANGKDLTSQSAIHLSLAPPVRVIPENLLFFNAPLDTRVSKRIVFRFADATKIPRADAIRIAHELPFSLDLNCSESKGSAITGELIARAASSNIGQRTIRGPAVIEFGEPLNQSVPISVTVISKELEIPSGNMGNCE